MNASDAQDELSARIDLDELTANEALDAMVAFYREVRADDVEIEEDGDMLVAEWSFGRGEEAFELHLTRQLIITEEDEDTEDEIWQLRLTLEFDVDLVNDVQPGRTEWCSDPVDSEELADAVREESFFDDLDGQEPSDVRLTYEHIE